MGRRRLPALLALVAGLLLGAGTGAQGAVASALHPGGAAPAVQAGQAGRTGVRGTVPRSVHGTIQDSTNNGAFVAPSPHPVTGAMLRAGRGGPAGGHSRDAVVLSILALLAAALAAFLVRQRRRSRPPGWLCSSLVPRGPPLLLAP
jgi:hypothetical protein